MYDGSTVRGWWHDVSVTSAGPAINRSRQLKNAWPDRGRCAVGNRWICQCIYSNAFDIKRTIATDSSAVRTRFQLGANDHCCRCSTCSRFLCGCPNESHTGDTVWSYRNLLAESDVRELYTEYPEGVADSAVPGRYLDDGDVYRWGKHDAADNRPDDALVDQYLVDRQRI